MMRRSVLTRAIAPLALVVSLVAPANGQTPPPARPSGDDLTRDTFADPNTPPHPPEPAQGAATPTHTRRTHLDQKDFLSVHHPHRRHQHAKPATEVAATTPAAPKSGPPRRRNPVVRFVYWWNGWVIRTFHTRFGTVLLGTVGAETRQG